MAELPYVEAHVTDHCNLNCRGCGHFSPLFEPHLADPGEFARDIALLSDVVESVGRVHLLGGEPLLHPDVTSFCRATRRAFPRAGISLVTNGLLLPRMGDAFWRALARNDVRLDITRYPVRLPVSDAVQTAGRHGVTLRLTPEKRRFFRVPLDPAGGADPNGAFARCRALFACPNLRNARLYTCPVVPLASAPAHAFGFEAPPGTGDFLDLGTAKTADLIDFLAKPVPWCRHCDFSRFEWFDWGLSRRRREEWL